jgi:carbon storage regulator
MIGDNIVITILGIAGGQCRIGIEAPRSIPVHREEVAVKIRLEKEAAAAGNPIPDAPWAAP